MNPESFKGNVRWSFTNADAVNVGANTPQEQPRSPQFKYDGARRSLEIRLDLNDGASYRDVVLELLEGIAATDGAKLKPWKLSFALGAQ
jgi:hypothetical protein